MDEREHAAQRLAHTRRDVLRYGVTGGAVLTAGGALAACGGGDTAVQTTTGSTTTAQQPRRGGVLRVGMISGGRTETLDPFLGFATNDYAREINLYDTLFVYDDELKVHPSLAESGEANSDNTQWTIRVREGATWHDGSAVTADDLIFNFRSWADPAALFYQQVGSQIDPQQIKKLDTRTVRVGLKAANARFMNSLAFVFGSIKSPKTKEGDTPIGTGPFKFKSFDPGARSVFDAFEDYWLEGQPYVDQLIMDSSFTDEGARLNALRSGAIDVMPILPFAQVDAVGGGNLAVLQSKSAAFQAMYMGLDKPPYDDVRVRQALRLVTDRQALVDSVYAGHGTVSNDVPGSGDPFYNQSLKRERDVEQAKALLKQAGKENLTVKLQTSTAITGLVEAATLFQQQAKEAGINVQVARVDPAAYFDPATNYGKMDFAQTVYFPVPSMEFVWAASFADKGASNETHTYAWSGYDRLQKLLAEARGTSDEQRAQDAWNELQQQQFDEGGYIIWGTNDLLDGVSTKVKGLTPSQYLNASGFNFRKAWLER